MSHAPISHALCTNCQCRRATTYDTTLARIAGNIASGMMAKRSQWGDPDGEALDALAADAVRLALAIVDRCEAIATIPPDGNRRG